jgi:hypothetical protein
MTAMQNARRLGVCLAAGLLTLGLASAFADTCPKPTDPIDTDRPDVTNSSRVVPEGSLQFENGINVTSPDHYFVLDGTNTRARLGIAPCLEVLVDADLFCHTERARAVGLHRCRPAVKWQMSPVPGKIDLSAVTGIGLPTGRKELVGPGPQPYLQFPWSWEIASGWGVSGMFTTFLHP